MLIRDDMEIKCTVVSFVPFELLEKKPGLVPPAFLIEASDTKIPSVLHVGNSLHYVYLDATRGSLPVEGPSNKIARSIVDDYISSQLGVTEVSRPALFWVPGMYTPGEILQRFSAECKEAQALQMNWFEACCRIADDDFAKHKQHNVVSSSQRKMATYLGWDPKQHDWMMPKSVSDARSPKCFACYSVLNNPEQSICHVCKAVLKENKELVFAS